MNKSKKICSIALAILLLTQLLFIPTFAESETTEDTTVTGKYTTADSLPTIYGAGVSVEDFEKCEPSAESTTFNFANNSVTDPSIKVIATNNYFDGKYAVVENSVYAAKGTKAFMANGSNQQILSFVINLNNHKADLEKLGSIAFYVDMPAGTVNVPENNNYYSSYPDGKYGLGIEFKSTNGNNSDGTRLSKYDVTYYFEGGAKLVKEDESGIYPYNADGTVSTTGFKGYVSVNIKSSEQYPTLNLGTNYYMGIKTIVIDDWNGGWTKTLHFDDFRVVNSDWFVPYALMDYESVASTWNPTNWYASGSLTQSRADDGAVPSFDTTGQAQGKNALKIIAGSEGAFKARVILTKSGAAAPLFGTEYNGIAFYIDIPKLTTTEDINNFKPIQIGLNPSSEWGTSVLLNKIFVYWFEDGSVLAKYGDDGVYPYDKDGNLTYEGFTGYVSVYFDGDPLTTNRFLDIYGQNWNPLLTSNQTIYIDDIRPCNFKAVEDIVSGDAYYINDVAIPVQKKDDSAALSVMPNQATLGMARNAEGLTALRKALLGIVTLANKHDVNGDDNTDIRDFVALRKLVG